MLPLADCFSQTSPSFPFPPFLLTQSRTTVWFDSSSHPFRADPPSQIFILHLSFFSNTFNSYQTMQSSDNASAASTSPCPPENTPASSPCHSPTLQIVTLDAQKARTPPPSPTLLHLNENVTVELLHKIFLETIKAVQKSVVSAESSSPLASPPETVKTADPRKRASKLEVKSILET